MLEALLAARQRARTGAYKATYARRAGCEGTLSRGVRARRLRRTRYVGQERIALGHQLTAPNLSSLRPGEWLADTPRATACTAPFATLMVGPPPV